MHPRQNGQGQQQHQPQSGGRQHQRFSWQIPPETPPEEDTVYHQQLQQSPQAPAQIDTNTSAGAPNRAFSYAQTPIEHRAPHLYPEHAPPLPQSPLTPIDPRPQSIHGQHGQHGQPQRQQPSYATHPYDSQVQEKPPLSPVSPYLAPAAQHQQHPALRSPVSPIVQPQQAHVQHPQAPAHTRQQSSRSLSPINTSVGPHGAAPQLATPASYHSQASPLPLKTPLTPMSPSSTTKALPMSPDGRTSYAHEPYTPHGFSASSTAPNTIFSPDAPTGPNGLDFALHQPGQATHPNMDLTPEGTEKEWKHSLCECGDVGTCITGLFCPCIIYGQTSYRLSQKKEKKDPTDMLAHNAVSGHCMLMGAACGLWWLFPMVHRTRLRHLYKLRGSCLGDLGRACCCCCCVAIQNEREVKTREESKRQWAGPASTDVYTAPAQMVYSPQR